ncbi:MAG: formate dehydrogenase accessory sulfurtransferase FdhD [Nitrospirota bacterium]|nr:formate dehydrogenase accessory sulfurtransferase FdhD [Nitrospirota bacterium]
MEAYKNIQIRRIRSGLSEEAGDLIAVEKRLKISINGKNAINLYCTPLMLKELVVGIIHSEGLITGEWCAEEMNIEYGGDEIHVDIPSAGSIRKGEATITSGCAGGMTFMRAVPDTVISDGISFKAETVRKIFSEFQKMSEIFRLTGGVHSAALTDGGKIITSAEDIGRHNAVDKVIGASVLEGISFSSRMMLVSGRLSSEIVLKCAGCGIPVLVSRAAPMSLAVEIAEKTGVTLVGFLRRDRMNVYTAEQRIVL